MAFDNNAKNKVWPIEKNKSPKTRNYKSTTPYFEKGRKGIVAYQLFHLTFLDNII
jgi:hypothetical protein